MNMPDEIYLCETEDEILWCEDDETDYGSGVRYIRADIREAEVQALKKELLAVIVDRNEWMDETSQGPADGSEARIQQLEQEIQEPGS